MGLWMLFGSKTWTQCWMITRCCACLMVKESSFPLHLPWSSKLMIYQLPPLPLLVDAVWFTLSLCTLVGNPSLILGLLNSRRISSKRKKKIKIKINNKTQINKLLFLLTPLTSSKNFGLCLNKASLSSGRNAKRSSELWTTIWFKAALMFLISFLNSFVMSMTWTPCLTLMLTLVVLWWWFFLSCGQPALISMTPSRTTPEPNSVRT